MLEPSHQVDDVGEGLVGQWWQCGVGGPHLYGFGNTLDKALTGVVGCKERGRQVDGPLDHSTGKGWVKDHAYGDGWVKKNAGCKYGGAVLRYDAN